MEKNCPEGHPQNIDFSKSKNEWICEACGSVCTADRSADQNNPGTAYSEECYWSAGLCDVAPVALAISYHQLREYAQERNVGCTLFLIRDVFELMIKIPVTILFNGIHGACRSSEGFLRLLKENTGMAKLYDYSMQMLSTGKWWECVRIASGLEKAVSEAIPAEERAMYVDTIRYLKELHKLLFFRIPGKPKVSMVTWRNRTLGHSCLADDPAETYQEIPYILKMLKAVGDISVNYYQRICLTDADRKPLRGIAVDQTKPEVYIRYTNPASGGNVFSQIHRFLAGRDRSLSCFDGYEKGKAYLLNYKNGERYRDFELSQWLTSHQNIQRESVAALPDENVFADNLESRDMARLEEQLMQREEVTGVSFLGRWLMDAVDSCSGGMLLLTAERGLGKSTFCCSIDPLDHLDVVYGDDAYRETLQEFLDDTAVRVWHFNSEYRSRKDIFVPGLRDALLTLSPEDGNRIRGRLESQYNNLMTCSDDLCGLYFAECLNRTMEEYRVRTDRQRLLLVLDGIDEVPDAQKLISFLPDPAKLDEGIYILLTSRTKQEVAENAPLVELLENGAFQSTLCFTRDTVAVDQNLAGAHITDNAEYRGIIADYVGDILREQKTEPDMEAVERLAAAFEYRFSSLAAYRKLCRISPVFCHRTGADLFGVFLDQVESNAPDYYVDRLKRILNTLAWVGEPITLRELAYLSGERYISYRLLGMINDMQAFLRVTRSSRGNCYELSHPQWEQAVKERITHGDILFRRHCNELIAEMEAFFTEHNIALTLESAYEGELWLLTHILDIYNRSWRELKENWFEEIRIGSVEMVLRYLFRDPTFTQMVRESYLGKADVFFREYLCTIRKAYFNTVSYFEYDATGLRGYKLCDRKRKVFEIGKLLEKLYDQLWKSVCDTSSVGLFQVAYDAADTLSGYISITSDAEKDRLILAALEYLEAAGTSVNLEGIIYDRVLLMTATLYKKQKQYHKAENALQKLIADIETVPSQNTQERILLANAYTNLGTVYYYQKNEEELNMYLQAYSIINGMPEAAADSEFLSLKRWAEHLIGDTYEERKQLEMAVEYWNRAVTTIDRMSVQAYSEKRKSLYRKIGQTLMILGDTQGAVDYLEKAYTLYPENDMGARYVLESLIDAYLQLDDMANVKKYESILAPLVKLHLRYADAYQEVLEIIAHIPEDEYKKIPKERIEFYQENQNHEHGFKFDFSRSMQENDIMRETHAIIVNLYVDYFATDYQLKRISEELNHNQMRNEENVLESILEILGVVSVDTYTLNSITDISGLDNYRISCAEVYSVLKHIPYEIAEEIPVDILMYLKRNRDTTHSIDLTIDRDIELLQSTKLILSWLFATYIPDIGKRAGEVAMKIPPINVDFLDD